MIEENILNRISPGRDEKRRMEKTVQEIINKIKENLGETRKAVEVNIYGSVSRNTWLTHEKDLDIFVSFPHSYSKKELEKIVTTVGGKVLKKLEKRFAEHPYVKGDYKGFHVEIVPCYSVDKAVNKISSVDRSPFHHSFIMKNIGKLEDDVRLLKQFMKGIGCYGAEVRVKGFSGYLTELLVIHYGSFKKVLLAASKWSTSVHLSFNDKPENNIFPKASLIFIDPTDKGRNVASALSKDKFSLFVFASKEYLKHPMESFFFPKTRKTRKKDVINSFKLRGSQLLAISFKTPDIIDDILYGQLDKAIKLFSGVLDKAEFSVLQSGYFIKLGKSIICFELENSNLPDVKLHSGPEVNSKNEIRFLEKHKGSLIVFGDPFIINDKWNVFLRRKHPKAENLLKELCAQKNLRKKGIPSYIAINMEKGFEIILGEGIIEKDLSFFADFFTPIMPWEIS